MTCMFLLHYLSVLYGIQAIPWLNCIERQSRSVVICRIYRELHILLGVSGVNFPPAVSKRIRMVAMKNFLVRRILLTKNVRIHVRLSLSSFDLDKYAKIVYDPSRFLFQNYTSETCQNPTACCWHPQRRLLLVTNIHSVFPFSIGKIGSAKTESIGVTKPLFTKPFANFIGIDVSVNGLIAVVGYNKNLIYLLNADGSIVGSYPITQQLLSYTSVCFSRNGQYIFCSSKEEGIHVVDIRGHSICTLGRFGAKPGCFRNITQITLLSGNKYMIAEYGNNRAQIVEIDIENQTLKSLVIFGNNLFIDPIGLAVMSNCVVVFSRSQHVIYVYTKSGKVFDVPINQTSGTTFASILPDGRIALVNQKRSLITIMFEDLSVPTSSDLNIGLENL